MTYNKSDIRVYDENAEPVDFFVFDREANSTNLSLIIKTDIQEGNNIIYVTFGNGSLTNISNSSIFEYYLENASITNQTLYTESYNFVEMSLEIRNTVQNYNYTTIYLNTNTSEALSFTGYGAGGGSSNRFNITNHNETLGLAPIPPSGNYTMNIIFNNTNASNGLLFLQTTNGSTNFTITDSNLSGIKTNNTNTTSLINKIAAFNATTVSNISFGQVTTINQEVIVLNFIDGVTGDVLRRNTALPSINIETGGTSNVSAVTAPQTNSILNSGNVTVSQGSNVTNYSFSNESRILLPNISRDVPVTVQINLPSSPFQNASYEFTISAESNKNELNLSLLRNLTTTTGKVYGIVSDNNGDAVRSGSVTASYLNGTVIKTTSIQYGGEYAITVPAGEVYLNFQADGYKSLNGTVTAPAVQNVSLQKLYNITITAIDSRNGSVINSFTTYLGEEQEIRSTDNGTVSYRNIEGGRHQLIIQSAGYNQVTREIFVSEDNQVIEIILTKSDTEYYEPHVAQFFVREESTGVILKGIDVVVYALDELIGNQTTGDDGTVTFQLTKSTQYTITFTNETLGVNKTIILTPANYLYVVYVDTNRDPGSINYDFNRYTIFTGVNPVYDENAIRSMGYDPNTTAAVLIYTVYNHNTNSSLTENTEITLVYPNGTNVSVNADSRVVDGSSVHYYIGIANGTAYPSGTYYNFHTTASQSRAMDQPVDLTVKWKISLSPIKDGFNFFPGMEGYYHYISITVLFFVIAAMTSFSNVTVTFLITIIGSFFFVWIGWLPLGLSAGVFLFLAVAILAFRRVWEGGN